ncbi:MAG: hydroxymethylbilane synthase [Clostridiales bacterium]|nr:hydroxymethylbilane synthase [Clostridiales bacterium]
MKIVVGTRGSNLALTQTNMVVNMIKNKFPYIDFEIKVIKTKGDIIQNVAIDKIGGKEIFIKEIEKELLDGTIDMAVHSMKDMPGELPEGLKLSHSPAREDYRDVLIVREGIESLEALPKGAKIATGSKRRKYQILRHRPDLEIVPIRGNVETRISKIETENLDGVIIAAAGVNRLGLDLGKRMFHLDKSIMLPSPTQGILAIEIHDNNKKLDEILKAISHRETEIQGTIERAFLSRVGGSCKVPVGAYAQVVEDKIILEGLLGSDDGEVLIRKSITESIDRYEEVGYILADIIMKEMAI